ncbi:unnamed protein product, partial [Amoebophrya sp. A25]
PPFDIQNLNASQMFGSTPCSASQLQNFDNDPIMEGGGGRHEDNMRYSIPGGGIHLSQNQ